jgi:hypothetical protein
MDAVDGANIDACGVLCSDTRLSDYVRHRDSPSRISIAKEQSRLPFAWKVSVYIIKPAGSQAGSFSQKVYHGSINASFFGTAALAWRGAFPVGLILARSKPRRLKPALLVYDH